MQPDDDHMMGLALAEAKVALGQGIFPVGAVLASGTQILGRSHKTMVSNHLNHAEMNLFHQVFTGDYTFSRNDGLTLYTTLEPCIMCFGHHVAFADNSTCVCDARCIWRMRASQARKFAASPCCESDGGHWRRTSRRCLQALR